MLTSSGLPFGRHSRPLFLKLPTNSFFFVSTDMTGSFAARNALACVLIYRNCASRSMCLLPSRVLLLACRLYSPCHAEDRRQPSGKPCALSSPTPSQGYAGYGSSTTEAASDRPASPARPVS